MHKGGNAMSKQIYINEIADDDVRFADIEEIQRDTELVSIMSNHVAACGMPIISDGKCMRVDNSDTHSVTIGQTGSGKTRRVIYEMLLSMILAGASIVMNDCKGGEVYRHIKKYLESNGYKVYILNFRNPLTGNRYNLLKSAARMYKEGETGMATEYFYSFATSIFAPLKSEDPFWTLESARYLTGLCMLACELLEIEDINLGNVYNIHVLGMEKMGGYSALRQYFNEERKTSPIWRMVEGTIMAPNDTQASILSVMTQGLTRILLNDDISNMINESDFDVKDIGREKTAVFLMTKDETSAYDALITSFVDQTYTELVGMAEKDYNGKLPQRVEFVMDEFGNMSKLNEMIKKITTSRSRNIRWHLVIQGMEQLSKVYGKDAAPIIIGNCGTWCYMNSSDIGLLKMISERCGETEDEFTNKPRRLLSVSRLQHFSKVNGECLILLGRNRPYITYLPDISEYGIEPIDKINLQEREHEKKPLFDIRKVVKKELDAMLEAKKKEQSDMPDSFMDKNSPFSEPMSDERTKEIIKKIDQRIKDLEEEEAKEREARENERISDTNSVNLYDQYTLKLHENFNAQIKEIFLDELLAPNGVRPLLSILLLLRLGGQYGISNISTDKPTHQFDHLEMRNKQLVLVHASDEYNVSIPAMESVKVTTDFTKTDAKDAIISYSIKVRADEYLNLKIDLSKECTVQRLYCLYQRFFEDINNER